MLRLFRLISVMTMLSISLYQGYGEYKDLTNFYQQLGE